jgi:hypothetical protein
MARPASVAGAAFLALLVTVVLLNIHRYAPRSTAGQRARIAAVPPELQTWQPPPTWQPPGGGPARPELRTAIFNVPTLASGEGGRHTPMDFLGRLAVSCGATRPHASAGAASVLPGITSSEPSPILAGHANRFPVSLPMGDPDKGTHDDPVRGLGITSEMNDTMIRYVFDTLQVGAGARV